jgi:small subunit ribosomal protein S17
MDKTVVVAIDISKPHRIYKKVVRTTKKIYAHDETNAITVGTMVRVVESQPLSKLKRWVVEEVIQDSGDRILEPIAGDVDLDEEPADSDENGDNSDSGDSEEAQS